MAKTPEPDPPKEEPTDPEGNTTDQRIASLEAGQTGINSKIDRILGIISGGGPDDPDPGDGGQPAGGKSIAHEIRAQLDARDAKAKQDAAAASLTDELGQVKAKVAELAEKPPAPMPRKVERIMGWR
jgi:hypothetical protein